MTIAVKKHVKLDIKLFALVQFCWISILVPNFVPGIVDNSTDEVLGKTRNDNDESCSKEKQAIKCKASILLLEMLDQLELDTDNPKHKNPTQI